MNEFLTRLTWVDYVTAMVVLRGLFVGYRDGIFPEILRIASYLATVLVAFYFYEPLGQWITLQTFFNNATSTALAFVGLIIAGLITTKILRSILLKLLKVGQGPFFLRLVGMVFGALRWVIVLSFIFMMIDHSPLTQLKKDIHTRSIVGEWVSQMGPVMFDYMGHVSPQLGLPAKS